MGKIKVAVNATLLHSKGAGLDRYTREVLRQLSKELHKGTLNMNFRVVTPDVSLEFEWGDKIKPVSQLVSPSLGTKGNAFRLLWFQSLLPLLLLKEKIDVFYSPVHEGSINPFTRQVITVHDLLPLKFPEVYPRVKLYFKYILPQVIRASSAVIVISNATKKDLIEHYKLSNKLVYVVHNGVDHNKFRPLAMSQIGAVKRKYSLHSYILCLASETRPYKNIDRLIEAYGNLRLLDFDLVIVGSLNKLDKKQLKEKLKGLRIQDRVRFLGYVPDDDLPGLYCGAEVFIFPSLYEGFGLPPLEAMACGCPVVVSNTSSLPEVCGDAAYYVDPYEIESIVEGIRAVVSDSELKRNLCHKGIERAKMFTWEKTVREILHVIDQISKE